MVRIVTGMAFGVDGPGALPFASQIHEYDIKDNRIDF
jgi:hypothetical protein